MDKCLVINLFGQKPVDEFDSFRGGGQHLMKKRLGIIAKLREGLVIDLNQPWLISRARIKNDLEYMLNPGLRRVGPRMPNTACRAFASDRHGRPERHRTTRAPLGRPAQSVRGLDARRTVAKERASSLEISCASSMFHSPFGVRLPSRIAISLNIA